LEEAVNASIELAGASSLALTAKAIVVGPRGTPALAMHSTGELTVAAHTKITADGAAALEVTSGAVALELVNAEGAPALGVHGGAVNTDGGVFRGDPVCADFEQCRGRISSLFAGGVVLRDSAAPVFTESKFKGGLLIRGAQPVFRDCAVSGALLAAPEIAAPRPKGATPRKNQRKEAEGAVMVRVEAGAKCSFAGTSFSCEAADIGFSVEDSDARFTEHCAFNRAPSACISASRPTVSLRNAEFFQSPSAVEAKDGAEVAMASCILRCHGTAVSVVDARLIAEGCGIEDGAVVVGGVQRGPEQGQQVRGARTSDRGHGRQRCLH
jgi:hypothetical protein